MQWNEPKTHLRLLKRAKSGNGISKINGQDVRSHKLLMPPIEKQKTFLDQLQEKVALSEAIHRLAECSRALQFSLVNSLLGYKQ
jgi:type I restriction enzyme S subunit